MRVAGGMWIAAVLLVGGCAESTPTEPIPAAPVSVEFTSPDPPLEDYLESLQRMVRDDPRSGDRRGRLAIAYEVNGFPDAALAMYQQAAASAPSAAVWPLLRAVLALDEGRLDVALDGAMRAGELEPQNQSILLLKGWIQMVQGVYADAAKTLEEAAQHGSNAQVDLGLDLVRNAQDAISGGTRLPSVPPYVDPYTQAKTKFLRASKQRMEYGLDLLASGQVTRGMRILEAVRTQLPDERRLLRGLVEAYTATRHPDWALEVLKYGAENHAEVFYFHYHLGVHYRGADELEAAAEHLGAALAMDPRHSLAREHLGIVLMLAGDIEAALTNLKAAGTSEAHFQVGMIEGARTNWAVATSYFSRAIEQAPQCVKCHLYMGYSFAEAGDLQQAEAAFDNARRHGGLTADVSQALDYLAKLKRGVQ